MPFPALAETQGKLALKRKELGDIFAEAGPDMDLTQVKTVQGTTHDIAAHIRAANDELTELAAELDDLQAVQKAADRARMSTDKSGGSEAGDGARSETQTEGRRGKSFGQLFVESKAFTDRQGQNGPVATIDADLKTLLTTSAGFAPEVLRSDRLIDFATRPIQVADVVPQTTTAQSAVQYMEETTYTNAAAETAEGGAYPESALAYTEQSSPVRKVSTFIPVTDEQLDDVPRMRGVLDNRLPYMVRQRLDLQLVAGNGTAPNLRGILNVSGIQTQAKGADPVPDAIYKALVKVNVTGQALANVVLLHPTDWQAIRLLRTADGIYIWGNPSDAGPERVWGLGVTHAQALTAGTAVVGDFANYSELAVRKGVDIQISNSHSTYFVEGKQAVRADIRAAFVVYRPAAFCTVTGL